MVVISGLTSCYFPRLFRPKSIIFALLIFSSICFFPLPPFHPSFSSLCLFSSLFFVACASFSSFFFFAFASFSSLFFVPLPPFHPSFYFPSGFCTGSGGGTSPSPPDRVHSLWYLRMVRPLGVTWEDAPGATRAAPSPLVAAAVPACCSSSYCSIVAVLLICCLFIGLPRWFCCCFFLFSVLVFALVFLPFPPFFMFYCRFFNK